MLAIFIKENNKKHGMKSLLIDMFHNPVYYIYIVLKIIGNTKVSKSKGYSKLLKNISSRTQLKFTTLLYGIYNIQHR